MIKIGLMIRCIMYNYSIIFDTLFYLFQDLTIRLIEGPSIMSSIWKSLLPTNRVWRIYWDEHLTTYRICLFSCTVHGSSEALDKTIFIYTWEKWRYYCSKSTRFIEKRIHDFKTIIARSNRVQDEIISLWKKTTHHEEIVSSLVSITSLFDSIVLLANFSVDNR